MFSRFLKYILPPFTFRVFFRRIFYSNLRKVPLEKPLLFVGNHQNSFMDGILIGSYLPQPIHFTMRADMFRKPFARFCLRELNVSPVYRIEEGFENVHKNLESFTGIYDVLKKNGNFIMFSEGICVQEKRLQKLRKGTARLAFGAEEKYGLDVTIVPVGINYTYPAQFRKEVMINFHDPFSIKDLKDIYNESPAKGLLAFNEKCDAGLRKEVIIIEDRKNDWLAEQLLKMERNNMVLPFFRWRFDTDDRRLKEKSVADKINHITKKSPEDLETIKSKVKTYSDLLGSAGLRDENVARKLNLGWLRYLAVIAGFPIFLTGYISNLIPFIIPRSICDRLIKDIKHYSSVYISSGTVLYLIYFPVVLILAVIFLGWAGFLAGLLVPLTGYLVLFYQEIFRERFNTLRYYFKSITSRSVITDLKNRREEIQKIVNDIKID
jgi:glycerol-3-phosphate O-acyltransferase / dihydroxyacetone phosphate acyltransferase